MGYNKANAIWKGGLKDGNGTFNSRSGLLTGAYTFKSRFEDGSPGTNPEEMIARAHASCFSMFLAAVLEGEGKPATEISTEAKVHLSEKDGAPMITKIELLTTGTVPGIDQATFEDKANLAKAGCPISKALQSVPEITVTARLNN